MRIFSPDGNGIVNLEQWSKCIRREHWKEGRSAYSLADFILNRNGSRILENRISGVLSQPVKLERATPEFRAKFDSYGGNPSNLDLGISGRIRNTDDLFVGLEAKVDERFGSGTVCQRYRSAIKERLKNPRSMAVARVEELLSNYFSVESEPSASRYSEVGYQLLTGISGTSATQKDFTVFYVLVFKTHSYDENKGWENLADYENFLRAANGNLLIRGSVEFQAHEVMLANNRIICIHDTIDFRS